MKPRSLGRTAVWGMTGALRGLLTGMVISAKTPGRSDSSRVSRTSAVTATMRDPSSAASATWTIFEV